jgi:ketosteroid isomerase-like protein
VALSRGRFFRGRQDCGVSDFDPMGIIVDWVDACRKGDLPTLLDLYTEDAELECSCNGRQRYCGRSELESYWAPRISAFSSAGFGLEEIKPAPHGIDVEYSVAGSLRFHASFRFSADGRIHSTLCTPSRQNGHDGCAC